MKGEGDEDGWTTVHNRKAKRRNVEEGNGVQATFYFTKFQELRRICIEERIFKMGDGTRSFYFKKGESIRVEVWFSHFEWVRDMVEMEKALDSIWIGTFKLKGKPQMISERRAMGRQPMV
ncbi:hypothetical protein VNO78_30897 [Psophocarpus tetragonolobus]